jgi:UDP-glucose 4-epimerase
MGTLLLIGASGFISQAIADTFANAGWNICGIDIPEAPKSRFFSQSVIYTSDTLNRIIDQIKPDTIWHGAGKANVRASMHDPLSDYKSSVEVFHTLLESIRISGLKPHVIFPSSAAVYGNLGGILKEDMPISPISPYGFHKCQCELLAKEYAEFFGIPVTVVRLFSLFGSDQRRMVIYEMFRQAYDSGKIHLQGTGLEIRDYLPVSILAEIILRIPKANLFQIINVASGCGQKIIEIAEKMKKFFNSQIQISASGIPLKGDPDCLIADISLLNQCIGDFPDFSFDDYLNNCMKTWLNDAK